MDGKKVLVLALGVAIALTLFIGVEGEETSTVDDLLEGKRADLGEQGEYTVEDSYQNARRDMSRIVATGEEGRLEIKILEGYNGRSEARRYVEERALFIESLPGELTSPYKGVTGRDVECSEDMKAENVQKELGGERPAVIYNLHADRRYDFDVCTPDQAVYRAQTLIAYCPEDETVYDITHFGEKLPDKGLNQVFRC